MAATSILKGYIPSNKELHSMENISIRAKVNSHKVLVDLRQGRRGLVFGTIADVAKQYGISITEADGWTTFSAPKKRLQIMAEKLHFGGVKFR